MSAAISPIAESAPAKATRRPRGSAPKPVRLEPNFGKSGIRIFVGESKIPVATITQETLDDAFGDYGFAPTGFKDALNRVDELMDERDQARADHEATDTALCGVISELQRVEAERDAAVVDARCWGDRGAEAEGRAERWQKAAARNYEDYAAVKLDLTILQRNFDELLETAKQQSADNVMEINRLRVEVARQKRLGWLYGGSSLVMGVLAFISLVVKGGR